MSDPKRLLTEGNELEQQVLRSWGEVGPSSKARQRALAIAGLGTALGVGAIAKAGAESAETSIAAKSVAWSAPWLAKAMAGILAIAAATTAVTLVMHPKTSIPKAAPSVSEPPVPAPRQSDVVAPSSTEMPRSEASPAPVLQATPNLKQTPHNPPRPAATNALRASDSPSPSASGLGAQVTLLDSARRALEANDPTQALRALDTYNATYPSGALSQEAEALRIEALVKAGRLSAAKALASQFIAANPNSPLVRRIRNLTGDDMQTK